MNEHKPIIATIGTVALIAMVVAYLPTRSLASEAVGHIRDYGVAAPMVYFLAYVAAATVGMSRFIFATLAGIVFKPVTAFLVVTLASAVAMTITFALARYFLADWVHKRLERNARARDFLAVMNVIGLKMVVLMRLNPYVPAFVNGYGFGVTPIKFSHYLLGSISATLPQNLLCVYLGWMGGSAILVEENSAQYLPQGSEIFAAIAGVVFFVAAGWYAMVTIKNAAGHAQAAGK